jgi:hypothetical protein
MSILEIGTLVVAIYAAIVSTAALRWNILRAREDIAKLSVSATFCSSTPSVDGSNSATLHSFPLSQTDFGTLPAGDYCFEVHATNTGKRPLTLQDFSLLSRNDRGLIHRAATSFVQPPTLAESESYSFRIKDFNMLRGRVVGIAFTDTHGRQWPLPSAEFTKIKELMIEFKL